jgi:hypothetical protein
VVFFTTLLFLKIFHWLCQDRVEFMDQTPNHGRLFHGRMVSMMVLLFLLDYSLALHAIQATWTKGPNMMIMFGFEVSTFISLFLSFNILTTFMLILSIPSCSVLLSPVSVNIPSMSLIYAVKNLGRPSLCMSFLSTFSQVREY